MSWLANVMFSAAAVTTRNGAHEYLDFYRDGAVRRRKEAKIIASWRFEPGLVHVLRLGIEDMVFVDDLYLKYEEAVAKMIVT